MSLGNVVSEDAFVGTGIGLAGAQLDRFAGMYERYLSLLEAGRVGVLYPFFQFTQGLGRSLEGGYACGFGDGGVEVDGVAAGLGPGGRGGGLRLDVADCDVECLAGVGGGSSGVGANAGGEPAGDGGVRADVVEKGKHWKKNRAKKERVKALKSRVASEGKQAKMQQQWRGYCETVASEKPSSVPSSCPGLSSATTSQSLIDAEAAARESLAKRRVIENELAMVKAKAQIASYADVEKSKAIAELKIARIAQWNNEARMKSQKSWAGYKRSLESSPVPSFKASDLPSAASAGEYWWKQQCLKSKEMEEQIKHLEAVLKASMPYVSPEGLEKMREVPDPEPIIDPEFEALKRAHRELAAAEGLDGYDSGDDIGYDLFMPPGSL